MPVILLSITTKTSLCEISSSHGGEYDVQSCLLADNHFTRQYIPEDNSEQDFITLRERNEEKKRKNKERRKESSENV
jgi:hypothetical protein